MDRETCPACGSVNVMTLRVPGNLDTDLTVQVQKNPKARLFKGTVVSVLKARVCGACGHTDLFAADPAPLLAAYEAARDNTDTPETPKEITDGTAGCDRCGSLAILDHVRMPGNLDDDLHVQVHKKPEARLFKGAVASPLKPRVCGECGYVMLFVAEPEKLLATHRHTTHGGGLSVSSGRGGEISLSDQDPKSNGSG